MGQKEVVTREDIPDELFEAIANENYELGKITGLEEVSHMLLEKAADAWKRDKDGMADTYRDLSHLLKEMAEVARKEWDKEYPKEVVS